MNGQERILATLARKPVDRTPIDCWLYQKQFLERLQADYGPREKFIEEFGIDVFVGLMLLTFANIRAFRGHFGPAAKDHLGVEVPGIYWHFVDVMWIVVFASVYLL